MHSRLLLIPPAIVAGALVALPATATSFLTVAEAQQLIFPGAELTPADLALTDAQAEELARRSGTTVYRNEVRAWKVSGGGWFFLDQVPGRDDRITYAVGIAPDGTLKAVEVLVCIAEYDQVRGDWRRHFTGRRFAGAHLGVEVPNISGATLSAAHLTDGITRILATYALFVAPARD